MIERALSYEEKRQVEELEAGRKIAKETRGWDDVKGETYSQRSKEFAQDYRYFPEPDLPPFEVHKMFDLDKLKTEVPELPSEKRAKYQEMGISKQDSEILALDQDMAKYFDAVSGQVSPKLAANWIINELKIDGLKKLEAEKLIGLIGLIEDNTISGKIAKDVLIDMIETGKNAQKIIEEKGLKQIGDESEIEKIVDQVISENSEIVASIKAGKTAAIGFLVGQIMKETKGQANPGVVNKILEEKIK